MTRAYSKGPKFLLAAACSALSLAPSVSHARAVDSATVTIVHTGETSVHVGYQCWFATNKGTQWWGIRQGPAAETNCSLVLAAFLASKSVSLDVSGNDVTFLCINNGGGC